MNVKFRALIIGILLLVVACKKQSSAEEEISQVNKAVGDVILAAECDAHASSRQVLSAINLTVDPGFSGDFCVNTERSVKFNSGYLRIAPFEDGRVELRFQCESDEDMQKVIGSSLPSVERIGLVAHDSLVGIYHTYQPADTEARCGVLSIENLEKAVAVCEAAAAAWGVSLEKCYDLCDTKLPSDSADVCVLHGRKK